MPGLPGLTKTSASVPVLPRNSTRTVPCCTVKRPVTNAWRRLVLTLMRAEACLSNFAMVTVQSSSPQRLRCSNSSTSPLQRAGEAYRRTPRGRGARRQRPRAIRASWRPQGRGASFRSDLQALDAARGGHVAAVLAGEARDGNVLAALAVSGCHLVAGRSGHLAADRKSVV